MSKELPPLLAFLYSELGYRVRIGRGTLGYDVFHVDLSGWKLRPSDRTPVIWVKTTDLQTYPPHDLIQSLQDVIRERAWQNEMVLVVLDGNAEPLLDNSSRFSFQMVFIGREGQQQVINSRRPTGELLDLILAQVAISNLAPYETSSPVTGSRFFGREYEKSRILLNPDTNYLVVGIRRIGKTSLIAEIDRSLREDDNLLPIVRLDCSDLRSADDFVQEAVRQLNPREIRRLWLQDRTFFFPDFLERMRRMHKRKITFLLDELDHLILMQRDRYDLFRMLRSSANKGACRYIMAGFREAMSEPDRIESPFHNFATHIRLNEFTMQQAHDLIVTPMENLRVRLRQKNEIVRRIYDETAGHPNLIQHYCMILLKRLDEARAREITIDLLADVTRDPNLRRHLLGSFMYNTNNREKVIVYALIEDAGRGRLGTFTYADIDEVLRKRGVALSLTDIDEACAVLVLAGVFHQRGPDFSFTSPIFTKMLQQEHNLTFLFRKAVEEGIWV